MMKLIRSIRWKYPIHVRLQVKQAREGKGLLEMQMLHQTSVLSKRQDLKT